MYPKNHITEPFHSRVTTRCAHHNGLHGEHRDPVPRRGVLGAEADRRGPFFTRVQGDGHVHQRAGGDQNAEPGRRLAVGRNTVAGQGARRDGRAERAEVQSVEGPVRQAGEYGVATHGLYVFRHGTTGRHASVRLAQHWTTAHVHMPASCQAARTR